MTQQDISSSKQPKGLYFLFLTEMWERFGFYTVQALLILFLTKAMHYSDGHSYSILGAYGALLYMSPVIGGYLADRFIGFRLAIFFGAILFIIGYACLALIHSVSGLYFSLALLICGNGFFKSNVSSLLGTIYERGDMRRDPGFTIFYMGMNIGVIFATIFSGYVAINIGWSYSFGIASIGMCLGMITFAIGKRYIIPAGSTEIHDADYKQIKKSLPWIVVGTIVALFIFTWLLMFPRILNECLLAFGIIALICILIDSIKYRVYERKHLYAALILIGFAIVFWTIWFQAFFSINLFIDRAVDKTLWNLNIPTPWFQSIIPVTIIAMSLPIAGLWLALERRGVRWINSAVKFAAGLFLLGSAYWILPLGIHFIGPTGMTAIYWVVFYFVLQALGEIVLSPSGLSMITKLSPHHRVGFMMGMWFLSLAAANAMAGGLAQFTDVPKSVTNMVEISAIYEHGFMIYGSIAMIAGVILLVLAPLFNKLISREHL